jgi:hypothetical protein
MIYLVSSDLWKALFFIFATHIKIMNKWEVLVL